MNQSIIEEAYERIETEQKLDYTTTIEYNNKFSPYNANVTKKNNELNFKLSKKWKGVSREITIGLLQDLLIKILKIKKTKTLNIKMYQTFLKNLHLTTTDKKETNEELKQSFDRVNEKYLKGMLETPNLKWGKKSTTQLATYNYHTDTITISTIFKNENPNLLDSVMYHEMLHKYLKFYDTDQKTIYHSPEFKKMEQKFENYKEASWHKAKFSVAVTSQDDDWTRRNAICQLSLI